MWSVRYTRTFLKELAALPKEVRTRVEHIVFGDEIKHDHLLSGKVQKLVGYQDYYKIRIGNYRVGLRIDMVDDIIEFQRRYVHRKRNPFEVLYNHF